ncbi:transposase [Streptomyces sp. NPDC096046]|uniref:transposase n=1 Tax=Streptomyces sp. NPDC096046 TaxID=3155542 RepID=UPI00332F0FC7
MSRRWTPPPSNRCASRSTRTRPWCFPAALGSRNSPALRGTDDEPSRPAGSLLHALFTVRANQVIEAFIDTGHHNAKSEGINRVIKLVARVAFGFRNANNQRLRTRCVTTRRARGHLRTARL